MARQPLGGHARVTERAGHELRRAQQPVARARTRAARGPAARGSGCAGSRVTHRARARGARRSTAAKANPVCAFGRSSTLGTPARLAAASVRSAPSGQQWTMSIVPRRRLSEAAPRGGRAARRRASNPSARNGIFTPGRAQRLDQLDALRQRALAGPADDGHVDAVPGEARHLLPGRGPDARRAEARRERVQDVHQGSSETGRTAACSAFRWPRRFAGRVRAAAAWVASSSATPSASRRAATRPRCLRA